MAPILAILAAAALAWLYDAARAAAWRQLGASVALVTVAVLWTHTRPEGLEARRRSGLAIAYHNLGAALEGAGNPTAAIDAYERAVAMDARSVIASMRQLGELYLARGDFDRAERHMLRVIEIKPDSRIGRQALVRLYEKMLQKPRWQSDAQLRQKLANAYRAAGRGADADRLTGNAGAAGADRVQSLRRRVRDLRADGRWEEAIAALQELIRVGPYDENGHYILGSLMEAHARPEEMVRYWSAEAARDAKPQTSHYFWAVGLERSGDFDGAIAQLNAALEIDPAHEMSELRWAAILEKRGRLDEALVHCLIATEILPDFRSAHETCARLLRALGRSREADAELELAKRTDPPSRRYVHWARYLLRKGRTTAAIAELERALREDPRDTEAADLLTSVRSAPIPSGSAP
jgi:superkiller protein 3